MPRTSSFGRAFISLLAVVVATPALAVDQVDEARLYARDRGRAGDFRALPKFPDPN